MNAKLVNALCLLLAVLAAPGVRALTTDRDQQVRIEADWGEADDKRRQTVYKGQVVLVQGSIRITGDTMTMHFDKDDTLIKLVALGNRATFRQLPDGESEYQRAKARRIEMFPEKDLMILIGKARAWQGRDVITADRIDFDTLNAKVKARTKPGGDGRTTTTVTPKKKSRVRVTITPKKKCSSADKAAKRCK